MLHRHHNLSGELSSGCALEPVLRKPSLLRVLGTTTSRRTGFSTENPLTSILRSGKSIPGANERQVNLSLNSTYGRPNLQAQGWLLRWAWRPSLCCFFINNSRRTKKNCTSGVYRENWRYKVISMSTANEIRVL